MVRRGGDCYLSNSAGMAVSCFIPQEVVLMRSLPMNKQWTTAVQELNSLCYMYITPEYL